MRRVNAAGDFATVLHRGDDVAGSIALIHRDRSGGVRALSRTLGLGGTYVWRTAATGDSVGPGSSGNAISTPICG